MGLAVCSASVHYLTVLCQPTLTAGGLVGEGKMEYIAIMGERARTATARTTSVVITGAGSLGEVEAAIERIGLSYPLVVKPDLGWCGFGVRRIDGCDALAHYVAAYPPGERLVLQEWLGAAGEAGLFYMRRPGEPSGELIGVLLRHFPRVMGDGVHTVGQLKDADRRAWRLGRDGASESCCDLCRIPARGEVVRIASVSSTRVGGGYEDGMCEVDREQPCVWAVILERAEKTGQLESVLEHMGSTGAKDWSVTKHPAEVKFEPRRGGKL